jgi:hypothetical protein
MQGRCATILLSENYPQLLHARPVDFTTGGSFEEQAIFRIKVP